MASKRALRVLTARPWLTAVVVVIVAGAATGVVLVRSGASDGSSAATAPLGERTVAVTTGTVSKSVSTTGNLEPAVQKDVSFDASSVVTSVRVAVGDRVTKGQVLGTINPLSLKSALASARATRAQAKATLAADKADDATSAQLAADRLNLRTARADVRTALGDLSGATLRSPITGIVTTVGVAKGDQTSGSSSASSSSGAAPTDSSAQSSTAAASSSSTADFEIIGTKQWKVTVDVDDTQVGLLAKGQQAQITTDNVSNTIFGVVSSVAVLSSSSSGAAEYPVTVTVTGTPAGLHDGAEATVAIVYRQASNVLIVPAAAIHEDGSSSYVYLDRGGTRVRRSVKTGLSSGTETQIVSGLKSGDQVYVELAVPGGGGSSQSPGGRFGNFTGVPTGFPGGVKFPGGFSGGGGLSGGLR